MPPDPRCSALASAMSKKGISYSQLAATIGTTEKHVIDLCTGTARPTDAEFKALTSALGIKDIPPAHSTA